MDPFLRDIARSLKLVLKERTFSATVLLTLALCLGANAAIYSVIHTVLLEPLPFPAPDRLVTVFNSYPGAGAPRGANGTVDFFQRRERIAAFEDVAVFQGGGNTVGEAGSTESASSMRVSASFFPLLGVEPAMGRAFLEEEMEVGNHEKVILTHTAWLDYFGGASDVVGRDLRLDGRPYTVVGVLEEGFTLPGRERTRFFIPTRFTEGDRQLDRWHSNNFDMLARLAPGATIEQAQAQNLALNDALIEEWGVPNARQLLSDAGYTTVVVRTVDDMVRDIRSVLYLLWGGVAFVLLIGCVNIANLMLARAQTRVAETATRLALGASRARVAGHVLTEAATLGLLGGLLGLAVGAFGLRLLESLGATELPRGTEIGIDMPVLAFTLLLALGAGAAFGALPIAQIMRGDLSPVFRGGGRTGTDSRGALRVRDALVTSQVALAFVLLIGAGLTLLSFRSALAVDPGFEPARLFTGTVSLPPTRYESADARRRFWDQLLAALRAIPGVESASLTSQLPFTGEVSASVITPEGYEIPAGESLLSPFQTNVGAGYFETMGIELVAGRTFQESDGPDTERVIVIDEWLANRYWPSGSAVGDRMVYGVAPLSDSVPDDDLYTVIGVVEAIKHNDLTAPVEEHVGAYYFTYRQIPPGTVSLTVRTRTNDPEAVTPAVREAVARLDPELPVFGVQPMESRIADSLTQRRIPLVLLAIFAGLALFLAGLGIYGALAYTVSQRTREIGIRIALGSAPGRVFRSVVGHGLRVMAIGLVLGAAAAYFLSRLIESLLFGVQGADPRVMGGVALLLSLVALAACTLPARRATRVNPSETLGG